MGRCGGSQDSAADAQKMIFMRVQRNVYWGPRIAATRLPGDGGERCSTSGTTGWMASLCYSIDVLMLTEFRMRTR